jgi:hypothetical protein
MLFELSLEAFKQSECIGGTAGEAGNNLVFVESSNFAGVAFHDRVAHGHLAVAANDYTVAAPDR